MVNHQSYSGWRDVAAQDGVVVVWPQGATELAGARDKVPSWNAGRCCGAAAFGLPEIDDVGFLRKLAASVAATHGADLASHVYWAGHSNGCAMAQRMAAEAPEIVAAVGCHALYLLLDEFDTAAYATHPVPIIETHGTGDTTVPYSGFMDSSAEGNLKAWATANACPYPAEPPTCTIADGQKTGTGEARFSRHSGCGGTSEVALITLPGVGHFPFKGRDTDVDTTQVQMSKRWQIRSCCLGVTICNSASENRRSMGKKGPVSGDANN